MTFTAGVGTASALKLYDAQSTTLKAKEGTIEVTSASFTVKAASASQLQPADAGRTDSGHLLQRDRDRLGYLAQHRQKLRGRKDAQLQRTLQLA